MYKTLLSLAFSLFFTLPINPSFAQQISDGFTLEKACKAYDILQSRDFPEGELVTTATGAANCFGYLKGVLDLIELFPNTEIKPTGLRVCVPKESIYLETLRRLTLQHLQDDPTELDQTARMVVVVTLIKNYPCKQY